MTNATDCYLCSLGLPRYRDKGGFFHSVGEETSLCDRGSGTLDDARCIDVELVEKEVIRLSRELRSAQEAVQYAQKEVSASQDRVQQSYKEYSQLLKDKRADEYLGVTFFFLWLAASFILIVWKLIDWLALGKGFW